MGIATRVRVFLVTSQVQTRVLLNTLQSKEEPSHSKDLPSPNANTDKAENAALGSPTVSWAQGNLLGVPVRLWPWSGVCCPQRHSPHPARVSEEGSSSLSTLAPAQE